MIRPDVPTLDRHLDFCHREAAQLRATGKRWAQDKAERFDQIAEVLRQVRQEQQMQGLTGRIG